MALAIILFVGWQALRRKSFLGTSPFSRWLRCRLLRGVECIACAAYTVESVTNAISGIIVVGALLQIGRAAGLASLVLSRCL